MTIFNLIKKKKKLQLALLTINGCKIKIHQNKIIKDWSGRWRHEGEWSEVVGRGESGGREGGKRRIAKKELIIS